MAWIVRNTQTGEFISGGKFSDYTLTAFESQVAKFSTREVARIAVQIICNEYLSNPEYFEIIEQMEKSDDHEAKNC